MDNQTLQPKMPWWRVKTMWLVLGGPAAVVVAGVITAVIAVGGADVLSGELPVTELFSLGGIRTFPGLRPGELRGSSYWTTAARYSWRLV